MRHLRVSFFLISGFLALSSAPARANGPISILAFQANGIGVFQTGRSGEYSGQLAWIPSVGLGGVGIRGEFGLTSLKNSIGDRFLAFNYEAFLTFPIVPALFTLEGGGGFASWAGGNGGTHPIASLYAVLAVPGVLQRVFVGYSRFFLPSPLAANELKLGLGFSL